MPAPRRFASLFAAAVRCRRAGPLDEAAAARRCGPSACYSDDMPESPWLLDLFTATRNGIHEPGQWLPDDRRRRATMRILGRTTVLHGADTGLTWPEAVESAVVFSDALETDPVLAAIKEAAAVARAAAAELLGQRVAAAMGSAGPLDRPGGRSRRTAAQRNCRPGWPTRCRDVTVGPSWTTSCRRP